MVACPKAQSRGAKGDRRKWSSGSPHEVNQIKAESGKFLKGARPRINEQSMRQGPGRPPL